MSLATAICWLLRWVSLNRECASDPRSCTFVLAISFTSLLKAFEPQGAFSWYTAWCIHRILSSNVTLLNPYSNGLRSCLRYLSSPYRQSDTRNTSSRTPFGISAITYYSKATSLKPLVSCKSAHASLCVTHQTAVDAPTNEGRWWRSASWPVHHFDFLFTPITKMNRLFLKKPKKSPKPSPQEILPKTPPDVVVGRVNHQADSNVGPEGEEKFLSGFGGRFG